MRLRAGLVATVLLPGKRSSKADLAGKLRTTEAQPLLNEAAGKDPDFGLAHLYLAQTAATPKGYFDHVKAAVAAAGKVSEGERLYIQGVEAGANGDTNLRGERYQKLVAAFPNDELSHQLLGIRYNAIQQYDDAAAEYRKAVQLAPNLAPVYNQLGYALRAVEKNAYVDAAFRRYIELIPNEPNPYDSLAELQTKMGQFAESIESYKKALSINPRFLSAYRGIGANLMYQDKHKEALESFQEAYELAATDGAKRQALAEQRGDKASMAGNAVTCGDLLLNAGKIADAGTEFTKALELARQADIPDKVKENVELGSHGNRALVACAKKEAEILRAGFEAS